MTETPGESPLRAGTFLYHANMIHVEEVQTTADIPTDPKGLHSNFAIGAGYPDATFHQHKISDSTASTESSPTTTISTVDDSSATEPSPGSSPESPPPATFAYGMLRPRTADASASPFFELQKQPPPRKGRNLKNLAVNTSRTPGSKGPPALNLTAQPRKEPDLSSLASPSFVKPPSPPRRRPSNLGLTLLTPNSNKAAPQEIRLDIPPTPAFGRPGTLRHFQSSPSLPLFPGLGSDLGPRPQHSFVQPSLDTILSPIVSPIVPSRTLSIDEEVEDEQNFDIPLSREEKPEAYPNGPICVYEPYVDLYAEPTAEQCRQYDVIFNVASEVRNPFLHHAEDSVPEPEIRIDGGGGIQYAPKRLQQASEASRHENGIDASPTTPKATPLNASFPEDANTHSTTKDPEYIHIPWEHNTDIVPDLLRLVKIIDDNVRSCKRVLVHCQCGVSRSASLVVAYGLYKDPTMSVQEAYDAVKKKSKWIGPNMNLIMQLQEFRTSLARGGILAGARALTPITPSSAFSEWTGPFNADGAAQGERRPLSALSTWSMALHANDPTSPGPSVAPMDRSQASEPARPPPIRTQRARAISAVKSTTAQPAASPVVDPAGHLVPVLSVFNTADSERTVRTEVEQSRDTTSSAEPLSSPRATEFAMTALHPPSDADTADAFGIMSPTSSSFPHAFDRSSLLASLGMGSVHEDVASRKRSLSLRSRVPPLPPGPPPPVPTPSLQPYRLPRLRGKISSPSLREQQQLQSLQAQIQSQLTNLQIASSSAGDFDDALKSPRATEFTKNPFALSMEPLMSPIAGPRALAQGDGMDPRSPAQTGANPITRNIMDVL